MMRNWLQTILHKWLTGKRKAASRPAPRLGARLHFDTLEDRTLTSTMTGIPDWQPPPGPTVEIISPLAPDVHSGGGVATPSDSPRLDLSLELNRPGLERLLVDVLKVEAPTPPPPDVYSISIDAGTRPAPENTGSQIEPLGESLEAANVAPQANARMGTFVAPARERRLDAAPAQTLESPARPPSPDPSSPLRPGGERPAAPPVAVARVADKGDAGPAFATPSPARAPRNEVRRDPATVQRLEASGPRAELRRLTSDVPDGSLLQRFVVHREQSAFTALVQRHERLVFAVCQRVLGDPHAAQDALQATFLVLARKASMLDTRGPLAGWLYQVAFRLALRLRAVAARQRRTEKKAPSREADAASDAAAALEKEEMLQALAEEVKHLPDKYRAPLLLCYFEGRTHEEAARTIGLPRGSMGKRISEGLSRLRERLLARGFTLGS